MFNAALLQIIEEAGAAVLILGEGLQRDELLRSRLTRHAISRQLVTLSDSFAQLPAAAQMAMPELGWDSWRGTGRCLAGEGTALDDALWFAVQSLVPATLLWLRVYRESQPELFSFTQSA